MKNASTALLLIASLALPMSAQQIRVQGEITVERVVVDAHVIMPDGTPVAGLKPEDFKAVIDGHEAEVESVDWIDESQPYSELGAAAAAGGAEDAETPRGRLVVIFIQSDRAGSRVRGQIKMNYYAEEFLKTLEPQDRVAVVSFDSHLKLRQDFTSDQEKLKTAITAALLHDNPPAPPIVPAPALATRLLPEDMKKAGSAEKALFLIGNALLPIRGPKTLVLLGWGLGRMTSSGVSMGRDYVLARRSLEASRTTVFSLDITDADYHTLEAGLKAVSEDTGGFYAKTNTFPRLAIKKLQRAIEGHYVVLVKKPDGRRGIHAIELTVKRRDAQVLARTSFQD